MGGSSSNMKNPWRDLPGNPAEIRNFVKSYTPANKNASSLRILLHGPVGAGKSSFVNSVESVILGRISGRNQTDAATGASYTTKYRAFKVKQDGKKNYCSIIFNDTMGFEAGTGGISVEDMKLAMKGNIKDNHKFNSSNPVTDGDNDYNPSPTLDDKVHVLVVVFPVSTIELTDEEVWRKLREVRLAARDLDIPQMAILTKVDDACPIAKDVKNMHKSIYLKQQVERFHQMLGIPINCIFLVKNYVSEMQTNDAMDAQILLALRQMINFGEDFLNELP